jgi:hypothetical protein
MATSKKKKPKGRLRDGRREVRARIEGLPESVHKRLEEDGREHVRTASQQALYLINRAVERRLQEGKAVKGPTRPLWLMISREEDDNLAKCAKLDGRSKTQEAYFLLKEELERMDREAEDREA